MNILVIASKFYQNYSSKFKDFGLFSQLIKFLYYYGFIL